MRPLEAARDPHRAHRAENLDDARVPRPALLRVRRGGARRRGHLLQVPVARLRGDGARVERGAGVVHGGARARGGGGRALRPRGSGGRSSSTACWRSPSASPAPPRRGSSGASRVSTGRWRRARPRSRRWSSYAEVWRRRSCSCRRWRWEPRCRSSRASRGRSRAASVTCRRSTRRTRRAARWGRCSARTRSSRRWASRPACAPGRWSAWASASPRSLLSRAPARLDALPRSRTAPVAGAAPRRDAARGGSLGPSGLRERGRLRAPARARRRDERLRLRPRARGVPRGALARAPGRRACWRVARSASALAASLALSGLALAATPARLGPPPRRLRRARARSSPTWWQREVVRGLVAALAIGLPGGLHGDDVPARPRGDRSARRSRGADRARDRDQHAGVDCRLARSRGSCCFRGSARSARCGAIALAYARAALLVPAPAKRWIVRPRRRRGGLLVLVVPRWDLARLSSGTNVYFERQPEQGQVVWIDEDVHGGVVTVTRAPATSRRSGPTASTRATPGRQMTPQRGFADIPAMFVPRFGRALVVGLGTGATLQQTASYPFEHDRSRRALPGHRERRRGRSSASVNGGVLDDPRVHVRLRGRAQPARRREGPLRPRHRRADEHLVRRRRQPLQPRVLRDGGGAS